MREKVSVGIRGGGHVMIQMSAHCIVLGVWPKNHVYYSNRRDVIFMMNNDNDQNKIHTINLRSFAVISKQNKKYMIVILVPFFFFFLIFDSTLFKTCLIITIYFFLTVHPILAKRNGNWLPKMRKSVSNSNHLSLKIITDCTMHNLSNVNHFASNQSIHIRSHPS